jgi:hypothetical protein
MPALTDDHDSEMSTAFRDDFVPLKPAINSLGIGNVLGVRTWLGRLAMPIPSEEGTAMVVGAVRR